MNEKIEVNITLDMSKKLDRAIHDMIVLRNKWRDGQTFTCLPLTYSVVAVLESLQRKIYGRELNPEKGGLADKKEETN